MATKKQIEANRQNSRKSTGPRDTSKTRYNATTHALFAAGITPLDKAEGLEQLYVSLLAEQKPVGHREHFHLYAMAIAMIREVRIHRLESQYLGTVLKPEFEYSPADHNLASASKNSTVIYGIPSQLSPGVVEDLVTKYNRCEAFYSNQLSRNEREIERLQRIRLDEHLPAPLEVAVTVHSDTEMGERVPNVKNNNASVPPLPAAMSNGTEATRDSDPGTSEPAGHVPGPFVPDPRTTELAVISEGDRGQVMPSTTATVSIATGATQGSPRETEASQGMKPTEDFAAGARLPNIVSQEKSGPKALWHKISPAPIWMKKTERSQNS